MGYKSDVRIKIETVNGLNVQSLIEDVVHRLGTERRLVTDFSISADYQVAIIRMDDIKWYDEFEDVQIVEQWFDELCDRADAWCDGCGADNEPAVCGAQFIRIGEDIEDNEDRYFGELSNPMYITRHIEE